MKVVHQVAELRAALGDASSVALVPTMGNLHDGHLSLVRHARHASRTVVTSIFVNPLQFAPSDDFAAYPRTFDRDCALLERNGCDIVFAPSDRDMYPVPQSYMVQPSPALANILEGAVRPGFFTGVCTVVLKLFNIVQPERAFFGKKDYQQLLVIQHMVRELALPIGIVAVDTVRESSGLAMSSRNSYLTQAERNAAAQLYATLRDLVAAAAAGRSDWQDLELEARARLAAHPSWVADYVAVRRRSDLGLPDGQSPLVALAAARLGTTRLIDNIEI